MCWGDGERGRMSGPQYGTDKPWGPNGYFLGVGRWAGEQVNLLAVETLLSVPLFLAFASWSHTHTYTHTHTLHSNTPGHLHQAKSSPPTPAQPPPTRSSPRSRQPLYYPSNGHWALTGRILEHQSHLGSRCCFRTGGSRTGGRNKHCVGAPKSHPPLNSTPPLPRVSTLHTKTASSHPHSHPLGTHTTHQHILWAQAPSVQFSSVVQLRPNLCNPMDCSMPGSPVHHQPPELAQTHVH